MTVQDIVVGGHMPAEDLKGRGNDPAVDLAFFPLLLGRKCAPVAQMKE
jgi:hypothetical protein